MRLRTFLLLSCVPALSACQMFAKAQQSEPNVVRLQGQVMAESGQLLLQPCDATQERLTLREGQSNLLYEVAQLGEKGVPLFVDLDGYRAEKASNELNVSYLYRLEREGPGCVSAGDRRVILQAQGHEPSWRVQVQRQGLVLSRIDAEPLALPYVEEQLGENRYYFSSEANGQQLELWLAPQRCVDSMSGTLFHMSAELRLNGEIQRGCASLAGGRDRQR